MIKWVLCPECIGTGCVNCDGTGEIPAHASINLEYASGKTRGRKKVEKS